MKNQSRIETAKELAFAHTNSNTRGNEKLGVLNPFFRFKIGSVQRSSNKELVSPSLAQKKMKGTIDWEEGKIPFDALMYGLTLRWRRTVESGPDVGDAPDTVEGKYSYLDSADLPLAVRNATIQIEVDKRVKSFRVEDLLYQSVDQGARNGEDMVIQLDSPFKLTKDSNLKITITGADSDLSFSDSGAERIFFEVRPYAYASIPENQFSY